MGPLGYETEEERLAREKGQQIPGGVQPMAPLAARAPSQQQAPAPVRQQPGMLDTMIQNKGMSQASDVLFGKSTLAEGGKALSGAASAATTAAETGTLAGMGTAMSAAAPWLALGYFGAKKLKLFNEGTDNVQGDNMQRFNPSNPYGFAAGGYAPLGYAAGTADASVIDHLTQQILASSNTAQWKGEGKGSAEANARDMAAIIASTGATDIKQFGTIDAYTPVEVVGESYNGQLVKTGVDQETGQQYKYVAVPTGDADGTVTHQAVPDGAKTQQVYGQWQSDNETGAKVPIPTDPSLVKTIGGQTVIKSGETYGNTQTQKPVGNTYGERQLGNAFGGTYSGEGNTAYRMGKDQAGNPVFYTTSASSSSLNDIMPVIQIALAATGAGGFIGAALGATAGSVAANVIGSAIIGGATAAATGGDILQGALRGGVVAGAMGTFTSSITGAGDMSIENWANQTGNYNPSLNLGVEDWAQINGNYNLDAVNAADPTGPIGSNPRGYINEITGEFVEDPSGTLKSDIDKGLSRSGDPTTMDNWSVDPAKGEWTRTDPNTGATETWKTDSWDPTKAGVSGQDLLDRAGVTGSKSAVDKLTDMAKEAGKSVLDFAKENPSIATAIGVTVVPAVIKGVTNLINGDKTSGSTYKGGATALNLGGGNTTNVVGTGTGGPLSRPTTGATQQLGDSLGRNEGANYNPLGLNIAPLGNRSGVGYTGNQVNNVGGGNQVSTVGGGNNINTARPNTGSVLTNKVDTQQATFDAATKKWFADNKGMTDRQIYLAAIANGRTAADIARATGEDLASITRRFNAQERINKSSQVDKDNETWTWFQRNPGLTDKQIYDKAIETGRSAADIARALGEDERSITARFNTQADAAKKAAADARAAETANWFTQNKGATDKQIYETALANGRTAQEIATATGGPLSDVQARWDAQAQARAAETANWFTQNPNATHQQIYQTAIDNGRTPQEIAVAMNLPVAEVQNAWNAQAAATNGTVRANSGGYIAGPLGLARGGFLNPEARNPKQYPLMPNNPAFVNGPTGSTQARQGGNPRYQKQGYEAGTPKVGTWFGPQQQAPKTGGVGSRGGLPFALGIPNPTTRAKKKGGD